MKIYIVGAGGVGGYFGGLMAQGGLDVTFVTRGAQYTAIKHNGLKIKSVLGDFVIKSIKVVEKISQIADPNLIFLCVKSYDLLSTAKQLGPVITPQTNIITLENGIDNDLNVAHILPQAKVYPGIAYVIASRTEPGIISQTGGLRKIIIGDRKTSNNPDLSSIVNLLSGAGVNIAQSPDIVQDLWKKFIYLVPFAGLTGAYRSPIGKILRDPEQKSMYESCIREVITVARAAKVNLPDDIFTQVMQTSTNTAPESKSSLLIDIERGRKTEIDNLHGTLIKLADKLSVEIPTIKSIYDQITAQQ